MTAVRIAVIGATGWLGGAIAREAVARGHEVTAIGRDPDTLVTLEGRIAVRTDATQPEALADAISGHDAVVVSVTDRSGPDRSLIPAVARTAIDAVGADGGPRLVWIGGGSSLLDGDGRRHVDAPDFPERFRPEALAQGEALDLLRATPESLDWTYLSPPPENLAPGDKRGGYSVRGDDRAASSEQVTASSQQPRGLDPGDRHHDLRRLGLAPTGAVTSCRTCQTVADE
jgi:putative NADH-flavin reductase